MIWYDKTKETKWLCSEETVPGKKPWSQSGGGKEVWGGNDLWNRKVLSLEWNSDGVMDNDSGESTGEDEVAGIGRDKWHGGARLSVYSRQSQQTIIPKQNKKSYNSTKYPMNRFRLRDEVKNH